jgi:hypothetical protein
MARYARAFFALAVLLFTVTASAGPFLKATPAYAFRNPEVRAAEFDLEAFNKGASEMEIDSTVYAVDPQTVVTEVGDDTMQAFRLRGADATSHFTTYKGFTVGDVWTPEGKHYHLVVPIFEPAKLVKVVPKAIDCGAREEVKATSTYAAATTAPPRRRTVNQYDLPQTIRLMVLYTSAAAMDTQYGTGSIAGHEAWIRSEVANLNLFAADSGASNVHFQLAYEGMSSIAETNSRDQNLSLLEQDQSAASLRKQYEADLVGLWTLNGGNLGHAPSTFTGFGPSAGFCVMTNLGVKIAYAFQHEFGHTLGAQHNIEDPVFGQLPLPALQWNRGYWNRGGKFQDIMGVARSFDGSTGDGLTGFAVDTIPRFSSATKLWNGLATGTDMANNARMLREGAMYVSQYHKQLK